MHRYARRTASSLVQTEWLQKWSVPSAERLYCGSFALSDSFGWLGDRELGNMERGHFDCQSKKTDKVGLQSMIYISLLLVIRMFYIRSLQTAVKRERKPH